jgi:V8-like Glu-specific endopeptidase
VREAKANLADVSAANIFGDDDRMPVPDTTAPGARAVAHLVELDINGELVSQCTGTFVSKHVLLTAAHCIYYGGGYVLGVLVIPGETAVDEPYGIGDAFMMAVPNGWADGEGKKLTQDPELSEYDFGIVIVEAPPWGNQLAPYPVLGHAPDEYLNDENLLVATIGFPGDKPFGSMWISTTQNKFVDGDFLITDIDVFPGQSGSGIYVIDGDVEFICAVISLSGGFANVAVRLSPWILDALTEYAADFGYQLTTYDFAGGQGETATVSATSTPTSTPTATPTATPTPTPSPSPAATASPTPGGGAGLGFRLALPFVGRD